MSWAHLKSPDGIPLVLLSDEQLEFHLRPESPVLCNLIQSQVLAIRAWTSLGAVFLPTPDFLLMLYRYRRLAHGRCFNQCL